MLSNNNASQVTELVQFSDIVRVKYLIWKKSQGQKLMQWSWSQA